MWNQIKHVICDISAFNQSIHLFIMNSKQPLRINDTYPSTWHLIRREYFATGHVHLDCKQIQKTDYIFFLSQAILKLDIISLTDYSPIANLSSSNKLISSICDYYFSFVKSFNTISLSESFQSCASSINK